ncbi:hypothetical protein MNEG_14772 [Monoraphidium neglectum]|uniref:Uncharacterized protein n=1 Tax=Monoraphidium neglectum TaxID=145388 RepID=A0A0D2LU96_9CHLO|nr:hypothetical protein MNEG_14772 [Monoraphidium neglectum]KIY93191.1 hypothetical protein MNEG_14772 [Monoraphidium neglectum]|eukprot:XP_013892211.1 hypothetical protein MNEG_14772 [Monoraphidium neglectum]
MEHLLFDGLGAMFFDVAEAAPTPPHQQQQLPPEQLQAGSEASSASPAQPARTPPADATTATAGIAAAAAAHSGATAVGGVGAGGGSFAAAPASLESVGARLAAAAGLGHQYIMDRLSGGGGGSGSGAVEPGAAGVAAASTASASPPGGVGDAGVAEAESAAAWSEHESNVAESVSAAEGHGGPQTGTGAGSEAAVASATAVGAAVLMAAAAEGHGSSQPAQAAALPKPHPHLVRRRPTRPPAADAARLREEGRSGAAPAPRSHALADCPDEIDESERDLQLQRRATLDLMHSLLPSASAAGQTAGSRNGATAAAAPAPAAAAAAAASSWFENFGFFSGGGTDISGDVSGDAVVRAGATAQPSPVHHLPSSPGPASAAAPPPQRGPFGGLLKLPSGVVRGALAPLDPAWWAGPAGPAQPAPPRAPRKPLGLVLAEFALPKEVLQAADVIQSVCELPRRRNPAAL